MRFLDTIIHSVIPHEKHKNIPHLLRKEFVTVLSVLVVLLFFVNANNFKIISGLNLTGAIYPAVLADMTNDDRESSGLSNLTWSPTLERASAMKAQDMVANSYFAHTSPRGVTPWYWFEQAKYDFVYAGENLALDFTESRDVQQAWLDSPTHRANVLSQNYTEIGISAVDGMFEGRNTTFVVEFFGKPQRANIAQANVLASDNAGGAPQPVTTTGNTEPEIAGATAETNTKPTIKIIEQADQVKEKFIGVQNTSATEPALVTTSMEQSDNYSTWYQRLAVNPTNAIKAIYGTILALVLTAMLLVMFKEYQKHHFKHLLMGVLLIVLTGAFLYSIESPSIILAFMQV